MHASKNEPRRACWLFVARFFAFHILFSERVAADQLTPQGQQEQQPSWPPSSREPSWPPSSQEPSWPPSSRASLQLSWSPYVSPWWFNRRCGPRTTPRLSLSRPDRRRGEHHARQTARAGGGGRRSRADRWYAAPVHLGFHTSLSARRQRRGMKTDRRKDSAGQDQDGHSTILARMWHAHWGWCGPRA